MSNDAKVRFTGDATGAGQAADKAAGGVKKVTQAVETMGHEVVKANEAAARAEKQFEQEVQKSVQRLQKKETQAKATTEAMKRLGMAEGGGSTRGALAGGGPNAGEGPGNAGRIVGALGKMGGPAGGALAGIGAGMAAGGPILAAAAAAVSLKVGFDALIAVGEKRAEQERAIIALEHERIDAIKAGKAAQGHSAIAAAQALGQVGRQALVKGANIDVMQGIGERTGATPEQAAEMGGLMVGLAADVRKQIEQAFIDAERLGGSGMEAARSLSADAREAGHLGTMTRGDRARAGLGSFGDSLSDHEINRALNPSRDLDNADALRRAGTRAGRAGQGLIANGEAVLNAQDAAQKDAARVSDPVAASLKEISDKSTRQVEALERQAIATGKVVELLSDISRGVRGGAGSYGGQAERLRAALAAAGGG
jgi:hypothetical protein